MTIADAITLLQNMYDIVTTAQAWDNGGEQSECRMMLDGLLPEHRQAIIEYRDDALMANAFDWAIALSHLCNCMTDPKFFEGELIPLSTN